LGNLKFALGVEPGNLELIHDAKRCEDLRSRDLPTLPSTHRAGTAGQSVPAHAPPGCRAGCPGHDASTPENEFR
jgi:hydroxyacylglutathione hydrolase